MYYILTFKSLGNIHLPREQWGPFDINLLSEAFFSIAYIFSFGHLLYFLQITSYFGPLQVRGVILP